MDFILSYTNNEMVMPFPVVPNGGISLTRAQDNITFDGVNYELQAIGTMNLASFELSSIFPNRPYPWLRPGSVADGWAYVRTIEAARLRRIPFRAIHLDNDGTELFNLPVTVDSFEYGRDQAGDVAYTLSCKEYRFAIPVDLEELAKPADAKGEATQTESQRQENTGTSPEGSYQKKYNSDDAVMMARTMWNESRGIQSKTEIACVGWTALNRVDAGAAAGFRDTLSGVLTQANQFAYTASAPTTSDYGYNLVELATDVLDRWSREKAGQTNVGRVLPKDYKWYAGDGKHNYFRNQYQGGTRWNYSLPSPYES